MWRVREELESSFLSHRQRNRRSCGTAVLRVSRPLVALPPQKELRDALPRRCDTPSCVCRVALSLR